MIERICVTLLEEIYLTCDLEDGVLISSSFNQSKEDYTSETAKNLRDKLTTYAQGKKTNFSDIRLQHPPTDFAKRVYQELRKIPPGKTITYGELAQMSGNPNASRAVGGLMAKNQTALILPCHRVVAQNGLGGFMGNPNDATQIKSRLLAFERNL